MARVPDVIAEIPDLYRIIPFQVLRRTAGAYFDAVPIGVLPRIDAVDRVIHDGGAVSPGAVGNVTRPWYMHPHQDDNLVVVHGARHIELYTPSYGHIIERFTALPNRLFRGEEVVYEGAAMLVWPCGVFHRIVSNSQSGSGSINLAVRYDGFDIRTNFNIYDVDTETGEYRVIREGHLDQPGHA